MDFEPDFHLTFLILQYVFGREGEAGYLVFVLSLLDIVSSTSLLNPGLEFVYLWLKTVLFGIVN
jgi:hypothetical protein